jgi:hypothetical protein
VAWLSAVPALLRKVPGSSPARASSLRYSTELNRDPPCFILIDSVIFNSSFCKNDKSWMGCEGGRGEKMVDHCMNDVVSHTSIRMPEVGLFHIPHNTWIGFTRGYGANSCIGRQILLLECY